MDPLRGHGCSPELPPIWLGMSVLTEFKGGQEEHKVDKDALRSESAACWHSADCPLVSSKGAYLQDVVSDRSVCVSRKARFLGLDAAGLIAGR